MFPITRFWDEYLRWKGFFLVCFGDWVQSFLFRRWILGCHRWGFFSTSMSWIHLVQCFWLVWVSRLVSNFYLGYLGIRHPSQLCHAPPGLLSIFYKGESQKTLHFSLLLGNPKGEGKDCNMATVCSPKHSQNPQVFGISDVPGIPSLVGCCLWQDGDDNSEWTQTELCLYSGILA